MRLSSLENFFLWIVKIGLWIVPFLPLYVSSSMLFPFITGKNFAFRIIIEVGFAFWAGLALMRPEYRPRLTPLFKAVTIFIGIVFLADLFGPNPYRSFFSNYERMEGFMMLSHLYLYFVMLTSVLKTKRDWNIFFNLTIIASVMVSWVALLQKLGLRVSRQGGFRVDSTIGNPAYLAAYLLFHVWLALHLLYEFWRTWWLRLVYGAILAFELSIIYFTATRGATLALVAGGIVLLAALVIFWKQTFPSRPHWRKWAAGVLLLFLLIPALAWTLRDTRVIRSSQILNRLVSISLTERTVQSRVNIWKMSAQASLERPILGWGQENYYLVFQKYFEPSLYDQEPWFDRSHNIIFDWLIHTGFLGLLAYLSIFVAAFWMLIRGIRSGRLVFWQGLVLGALFLAYFLQNLFVFDNLNTYILFFAFLAFTQFSSSAPEVASAPSRKNYPARLSGMGPFAVTAPLLVVIIAAGYFLHLAPILQSKALIRGLSAAQFGAPFPQLIREFQTAVNYNSFGTTEAREQLANFARGSEGAPYTPEEKKELVEFAAGELRQETLKPAKDVKHLLFLGSLLTKSLADNPDYLREAEQVLREARHLSPSKQIIYFELAQFYLSTGNTDKALAVLEEAWNLDKNFKEAGANVLTIAMLADRKDVVASVRQEINFAQLQEDSAYRVALAAQRKENFVLALEVYEALVKTAPDNPKYRAALAALLAHFGRTAEARVHAEEAARLDPEYEKELAQFLQFLDSQK